MEKANRHKDLSTGQRAALAALMVLVWRKEQNEYFIETLLIKEAAHEWHISKANIESNTTYRALNKELGASFTTISKAFKLLKNKQDIQNSIIG